MFTAYPGDITKVHGIRVGQVENENARTGVTVVLAPSQGAVAGVSVRGAAPGTRETDALRPGNLVDVAHAVVLAGGSAFGLAAADGVMRFLRQNNVGLDMGVARVPIVPAAVLFDLAVGDAHITPDAAMGRAACMSAGKGAAGATARPGLPWASWYRPHPTALRHWQRLHDAVGGVTVVRWWRQRHGRCVSSRNRRHCLAHMPDGTAVPASGLLYARLPAADPYPAAATPIGVAVDCVLDKAQANRLADERTMAMPHHPPRHTQMDGDTVFALAKPLVGRCKLCQVCAAAAR